MAARAGRYWRGRERADDYFWVHGLFADAYREDAAVRDVWDNTPRISSRGPHYWYPYGDRLLRTMTRADRSRLLSDIDPVYKLSHRRCPIEQAESGSAAAWFCGIPGRPQRRSLVASIAPRIRRAVAGAKYQIETRRR